MNNNKVQKFYADFFAKYKDTWFDFPYDAAPRRRVKLVGYRPYYPVNVDLEDEQGRLFILPYIDLIRHVGGQTLQRFYDVAFYDEDDVDPEIFESINLQRSTQYAITIARKYIGKRLTGGFYPNREYTVVDTRSISYGLPIKVKWTDNGVEEYVNPYYFIRSDGIDGKHVEFFNKLADAEDYVDDNNEIFESREGWYDSFVKLCERYGKKFIGKTFVVGPEQRKSLAKTGVILFAETRTLTVLDFKWPDRGPYRRPGYGDEEVYFVCKTSGRTPHENNIPISVFDFIEIFVGGAYADRLIGEWRDLMGYADSDDHDEVFESNFSDLVGVSGINFNDLALSHHAKTTHQDEEWNAVTILELFSSNHPTKMIQGKTSDVLVGFAPGGECVGLIVSKGIKKRVVITGFAAPMSYWEGV